MVIDKMAIMHLLMIYGLLPRSDNRHIQQDNNRARAAETLWKACDLKF